MRKICVVTGSRAEYGLLSPVMRAIQQNPNLELVVIVTGMHLMERFGYTVNEIREDGFKISAEVTVAEEDDISCAFGQTVIGISKAIKQISDEASLPDFVVVLGDRFEALAGAVAGASNNIAVAHIHGGDKTTSGHIDESIRYAVTNFAHLHFAATKQSAFRLKQVGEEQWRIHQVGSPALDSILEACFVSSWQILDILNLDSGRPIVVVLQHPVSLEVEEAGRQMEQTMLAVKELSEQTEACLVVVIYPNSDPGGKEMIEVIEQYRGRPNIQIHKNLNHAVYLGLLRIASVLVGNSSSGIIEAPSFGLPVVNVGSRNVGREHAENVIFVHYDQTQILAGIKKALFDEEFKEKVSDGTNPYGDGKTSQRIVDVLATIPIDKKLLKKQ